MPGCALRSHMPVKAPSYLFLPGAAGNRRHRHSRAMHLSVIMPVLNEEAVLETTLIQLTRQFAGQHYELIIVDGGSSFRAIGGYPDQPLMEDLEIIARLRKCGKVILLPQYVTTSARRHEKVGLLRSVFFMWYLRTLYRLGISPAQLRRMYADVR